MIVLFDIDCQVLFLVKALHFAKPIVITSLVLKIVGNLNSKGLLTRLFCCHVPLVKDFVTSSSLPNTVLPSLLTRFY